MRIIAEQRYIEKLDGRKYLQCKYYTDLYVDASGSLGFSQSKITEWVDVPLCLNDWPEDDVRKALKKVIKDT